MLSIPKVLISHNTLLTFMKTSISGSGLIWASFSLLDKSANHSVDCQKQYTVSLENLNVL